MNLLAALFMIQLLFIVGVGGVQVSFDSFFGRRNLPFPIANFLLLALVDENIRSNKQRTGKKFLYVYVYFHDTVLL